MRVAAVLFFRYSSTQALDQCFELFEASAHFGFALAKLIGRDALMDRVFEFRYSDAE